MTQVRLGIYLETKDHCFDVKSHKHDCGIDEACITLQNIENEFLYAISKHIDNGQYLGDNLTIVDYQTKFQHGK
tara:strand:- start:669 stop:890 length:222 start_codon:yes stop_codon:yes gene_type:complete